MCAAFVLWPTWVGGRLEVIRSADHNTAPITRTIIGAIASPLVLRRWRRPEARLLFAMAWVPQTPAVYETLPICSLGSA